MIPCSWKEQFGIDCLSCGAQRSFIELIGGDLLESILLFPALIPFLGLVVFTILHFIFKFKHGARVILVLFSICVFLMILNFVIKLMNGSAFH